MHQQTAIILPFLLSAAGLFLAASFSFFLREHGISLHTAFRAKYRPISLFGKFLFCLLSAGLFLFGGAKTNAPPRKVSRSSPPPPPSLTAGDFARGFTVGRIGTNEPHSFSPCQSSSTRQNWLKRGASEDWFNLEFSDWEWFWNNGPIRNFRIFSNGEIHALGVTGFPVRLLPFKTVLGIVPQSNWQLIAGDNPQSRFWHAFKPDNSLLLTWENVIFNRDPSIPISFQTELSPSGGIVCRYDLSHVSSPSNVLIGIESAGNSLWLNPPLTTNLSSIAFHQLDANDSPGNDADGDGLTVEEEIFIHGTDPYNPDSDFDGVPDGEELARGTNPTSRDTDGDGLVDASDPNPSSPTSLADLDCDGLPDAYETHWFGGTNVHDNANLRDATGFSLAVKLLAGINPTNSPSPVKSFNDGNLASWNLFSRFALDLPRSETNLVWERTFPINRTSAWEQYFVSSSPTNASGWLLHGMQLEWETENSFGKPVRASPAGDSFRIPLSRDDLTGSLTLRLRRNRFSTLCAPQPLYLIRYAPEFDVECGIRITGTSGRQFAVFQNGTRSDVRIAVRKDHRPCKAVETADERDPSLLQSALMANFDFGTDGNAISVWRPGVCDLPNLAFGESDSRAAARSPRSLEIRRGTTLVVLDPFVRWECNAAGCSFGGLDYSWDDDWHCEIDHYPLDSSCLRRRWSRTRSGVVSHTGCVLEVETGAPDCDFITTRTVDDTGTILVDGVPVWSDTAEHNESTLGGESCSDTEYREEFLREGSECGDCGSGCENGNCDSLEGASLGSLKFRIPLGIPGKDQLSGFVWFEMDEPGLVSPQIFRVLKHPEADVDDLTFGDAREVVCRDLRGRTLRIESIPNGVRITVRETASARLEHSWELVNPNGNPNEIRLRKISRSNNVMSDESFRCVSGDWVHSDNVSGLETCLETSDMLNFGGIKRTRRTATDPSGQILEDVVVEESMLGEFANAVRRETFRSEQTGNGVKWSRAEYWDDPAHPMRHGRPRLVWGNARKWIYTDFDSEGRDVLRIEQINARSMPNSFPSLVSGQLPALASNLTAIVTIFSYAPHPGDSNHPEDRSKIRTESRYLSNNGALTLIGRTWSRYQRIVRDGFPAIKREQWRAASQNAEMLNASNAFSSEIAYSENGDGTPSLMRGAPAETLDEDGIRTVHSYTLNGNMLKRESRKFFGSVPFPEYETTETHATHGTQLYRATLLAANNAVLESAQSAYDEKNRLRSTLHHDGSYTTNHYSCCRLLWRQDRSGRKILRSAKTGTDHLYRADEDVWLASLSTNGRFRITQRFFDALGRETNTLVYAGSTPGEAELASASAGKPHSTETTAYPNGGSGFSIHTDARGKVAVSRIDFEPDGTADIEIIYTNGVQAIRTELRRRFGGGTSMRREWDGKFSEERRFSAYTPVGKRVDSVMNVSSDCGTVTNSVSTYDLLDRLVEQRTVIGVSTFRYDGSSSRAIAQSTVAGNITRESTFLYDAYGRQTGVHQDGVTTRTDVSYETDASNVVWRVTTECTFGDATNSCTVTRERLTGLSAACRSCTIKTDMSGALILTRKSLNPETGVETETTESSTAGTVSSSKMKGLAFRTSAVSGDALFSYDAFGSIALESRAIPGENPKPLRSYDYALNGDLLASRTWTNATAFATESYAYDKFGNRTATTDALGNVTRKSYDPLGNVTAEWGATYPVHYTYDTQNRLTSLATTRDSLVWDVTRWTYNPHTGLCTAKIYPDDSQVLYSHTPDGLPLRTTFPGGCWIENVYNAKRELTGTVASDGEFTMYVRNEFGGVLSESNNLSSVVCALSSSGIATNEFWTIGDSTATIARTLDNFGRLSFNNGMHFTYASEGNLLLLSNEIASVEYQYTPDRLDAGYVIRLPNGFIFSRQIQRDPFRRTLPANIVSTANGSPIDSFAYEYDALARHAARNSNAFAYNARSELVSASSSFGASRYAYDYIGNCTAAIFNNTATNLYLANSLNQYTAKHTRSPSPRETNFQYDPDGNLLSDGALTYSYDASNRLKTVSSNGTVLVANFYDAQSRRIRKTTPTASHVYFYDNWNLAEERIASANGTHSTVKYYWGKDLSGTLHGAGGVGGLLFLTVDGAPYVPCYDNNGNITKYLDANGAAAASYAYTPFGGIVSQSGPMADFFRHRFSTKYFDPETGLYCYGRRFHHPTLMRWLNRDPIGESGGLNLFAFCGNNPLTAIDFMGLHLWFVLYYDEQKSNSNFKRAAETCKRNIQQQNTFNPYCDSVEIYGVRTKEDFHSTWSTLNAKSRDSSTDSTRHQVKGLYLYTHSGPGAIYLRGGTIEDGHVKKLPKLNWANDAEIQCFGCSSGVPNEEGNSLAGSLSASQQVPALGQASGSSFSGNPDKKSKWGVILGFSDVYLWSYDSRGNKIPPIKYP